jgi:hypothetical protein
MIQILYSRTLDGAARWHVKRPRGLTTERRTPWTDHSVPGGLNKSAPHNTEMLNDPLEVHNDKVFVVAEYGAQKPSPKGGVEPKRLPGSGPMLVDLAGPKDTIINPETLVPPQLQAAAGPAGSRQP